MIIKIEGRIAFVKVIKKSPLGDVVIIIFIIRDSKSLHVVTSSSRDSRSDCLWRSHEKVSIRRRHHYHHQRFKKSSFGVVIIIIRDSRSLHLNLPGIQGRTAFEEVIKKSQSFFLTFCCREFICIRKTSAVGNSFVSVYIRHWEYICILIHPPSGIHLYPYTFSRQEFICIRKMSAVWNSFVSVYVRCREFIW